MHNPTGTMARSGFPSFSFLGQCIVLSREHIEAFSYIEGKRNMLRKPVPILLAAMVIVNGFANPTAQAFDILWDGGDGVWADSNWDGGEFIDVLVGTIHGSDGYGGIAGEEENIIIGSGSTVTYEADINEDFYIKQGGSLTIQDGAVWQQLSDDSWPENMWTEMDATRLTLDNGTFRRTGSVSDEGGGALIFGSWRADDNFNNPASPLDHFEANIVVQNGGLLQNEGQLWFGSWGDTPPNPDNGDLMGSVVVMTINDGALDLTGGDVVMDPEFLDPPANADLVFSNRFNAEVNLEEHLPTYGINFTGPGSITVDSSGIINAYVDEDGEWQGLEPITYQELWDVGILQANGRSGLDGAEFANYFSVTGVLGADDYTLTSNVSTLVGDYNNNQEWDAGDLDLQAEAIAGGQDPAEFDLNGDGRVDYEGDRLEWLHDLKQVYVGDADLNGLFESVDFVAVFVAGKYETQEAATWAEGDWDANLVFDSGDFVAAFVDGGYEQGPYPEPANAVPEPSGLAMSLICLSGLIGWLSPNRRRK